MLKGNFPEHKKLKQELALLRQEARNKRTPQQQLEELDRKGMVATKERAKLQKLIEEQSKPKQAKVVKTKKDK